MPLKLTMPKSPSVVAPGVSSTKSVKLRPFSGRDSMLRFSTTLLSADCVASTSGASALTLTVTLTLPIFSCGRTEDVVPTRTSTCCISALSKPSFLTEIS